MSGKKVGESRLLLRNFMLKGSRRDKKQASVLFLFDRMENT